MYCKMRFKMPKIYTFGKFNPWSIGQMKRWEYSYDTGIITTYIYISTEKKMLQYYIPKPNNYEKYV